MKKFFLSLLFGFFLFLQPFLFNNKTASASEGIIEIRSTTNESYRCFAASVQLVNLNYSILVTCRDLLYPTGGELFYYVVWADPVDSDRLINLGDLGYGKINFTSRSAFTDLYVTAEKNPKVRVPEGQTVMRGSVKRIEFLETTQFEETSRPETTEEVDQAKIEESETPSARERLFSGLRRAALVSFLALTALIGLIFVLTRK
jgi:hypothetical protein